MDNHEFKVIRLRELPLALPKCDCAGTIAEYWSANVTSASWYNPDVECLVATGTMDTLLSHPREVFRTAIIRSAAAIVLAHNHPSGDPTPSEADVKVTRDLIRAGQLLRIEVLDHVVIGRADGEFNRGYCSLRELGYWNV